MNDVDDVKIETKFNNFADAFQILDRVTDGFISVDREWRYTYINRAGAAMANVPPESFIGKTVWEMNPGAAGTKFQTEYERALRENAPVTFTEYLEWIDLWLEVNAYPSATGLSIFFRDVTEQKRAETTIQRQSQAINHSHEPIMVWSLQKGIVEWNRGAEQLYGYTKTEAIGQITHQLLKTVHPLPLEKVIAVLEQSGKWNGELQQTTKDGRKVIVESHHQLLQIEGNWLILETNRDITERKGTENALRESEKRLRLVTDSMPALISYVDSDFCYRFVNQEYTNWFGLKAEEIVGKHVSEILGEAAYQAVLSDMKRALAGEIVKFEQLMPYKTGKARFVEIKFKPEIESQSGQAKGFYAHVIDITERRQAELDQTFLLKIGETIRLAENPDELVQDVLEAVGNYFKVSRALFAEIESEQHAAVISHEFYETGLYPIKEKILLSRFSPNSIEILRNGQMLINCDTQNNPRTAELYEAGYKPLGINAFVGVPLLRDGRLLGAFALVTDVPREWTEAEIGLLETVAERAWLAVERLRSEAALRESLFAERQAREESEIVRRLGQIIAAELDLHKIVQAVIDAAREITGAQFGAFFYNVLNEKGESYMLYTLSGAPYEAFSNYPTPRATHLFGPTFRNEGTLRSDDIKQDSRFGKNHPYYGMPEGHLPVSSYLAVSVISRTGEVLGGLFFGHHETGIFTERHERIVEAIAAQAAVAIDNARLFKEAKRERERAQTAAAVNERLFKEAQEANRLKDEFLATVSHELRTPLNAIMGWSSILLTKSFDDVATIQKAIETIHRNARSQAQIIEDILDVSRIITGKLQFDVQPVQASKVIEAAVDSLQHAAEAKGVHLQILLDPAAGMISGDPDRLQQIVWNLVSNAVKFTPLGGLVRVQLERVNSHIEIAVSDTGQGIAPEFLPEVFDRFRQADSSITRKHGGLGLGLAIVKQLVEMHGGNIRAESPGINQGATFIVQLPVTAVQTAKDSNQTEHALPTTKPKQVFDDCPPNLKGLRVLAVDDENDSRELLKNVLASCEAEVLTAASTEEALAVLPEFNPQILVSDIGMPDQDGYELIRELRKRENAGNSKRIPAVALTAYARVEDRMKALSAGFQMHVSKPVEPAELTAVIASLVKEFLHLN